MSRRRPADGEVEGGAAFAAACRRARGRYAAAVALVLLAGCSERERWPEPERTRPAAKLARDADLDCNHGDYCTDGAGAPAHPGPAPFAACEAAPPVPDDVVARTAPGHQAMLRVRFDVPRTQKARGAGRADACCYFWFEHCHGRPVLVRGRAALPAVATRSLRQPEGRRARASAGAPIDARGGGALAETERGRLARAWLRDARFEHASITAFERFALDLEALGAPAALIAASRSAARDEARHAALAFARASSFSGARLGPGRFAPPRRRARSLAALAASTYAEGCVAETIAAALVAEAARGARGRRLARELRGVARDEARHAELAWRTVAWALDKGGAPVRRALERAAAAAASGCPTAPAGGVGARGPTEPFGVLDARRRRALAARAFDAIVRPCTVALLAGHRDPSRNG